MVGNAGLEAGAPREGRVSERCTRTTALVLLAIGVALTALPVAALAQQPESAAPEAAPASEPPTTP
jgi:hypothetical protein